MVKSTRAIAGAFGGALLLALAVASAASASGGRADEVRALAESVRAVWSTRAQTALTVDDIAISDQIIAVHQRAIEHNGVPAALAHQQAIDKAVRDALAEREATRRGFVVSDSEISAFIAEQRVSNAKASLESRLLLRAMLQGLGMTEDQYWGDARTRAAARSLLLNARLVEALTPAGGSRADGVAQLDGLLTQLQQKAVIRNAQ